MIDKLEELGLKTRTVSALKYARIVSITALLSKSRRDLRGIYGLGKVGIDDIERALGQKGLKLKTASRKRPGISLIDLHARLTRLEYLISNKQPELPFKEANN